MNVNQNSNNFMSPGVKSQAYMPSNQNNKISNSTPSHANRSSIHSSSVEEKERQKIQQLQKELDYYKKRCSELEFMNNLLLQQQQQQQYVPPNPYHPPYYPSPPYMQQQQYPPYYPPPNPMLSHSQVSSGAQSHVSSKTNKNQYP